MAGIVARGVKGTPLPLGRQARLSAGREHTLLIKCIAVQMYRPGSAVSGGESATRGSPPGHYIAGRARLTSERGSPAAPVRACPVSEVPN